MAETFIFLCAPLLALIVFAAFANWIIKRIDNLDKSKKHEKTK